MYRLWPAAAPKTWRLLRVLLVWHQQMPADAGCANILLLAVILTAADARGPLSNAQLAEPQAARARVSK
jgi:hypothetical protein